MDLFEYAESVKDPQSRLYEEAKAYFDENRPFLSSLKRAAGVMQRHNGKVSTRFLVEFARWLRFMGYDGMMELLECFQGVVVKGTDVAAIPNAYSAYLTRLFERDGFKVTKAKSKMDVA